MKRVKESLNNMIFAACVLTVPALATFSVTNLIYKATGWKMPNWLAISIAGMTVIAAVAAALLQFGVSIPQAVKQAVAIATTAAQ